MNVIVLGAGLGTRLRPLTDELPKPAAPLMGVPLIGVTLARLARAGVRRAVVNAHHLPDRLMTVVGDWCASALPDLELRFSVERPAILGTGGALVAARPWFVDGQPVAVVNGDILCDFDLAALRRSHDARGAFATLLLAAHPDVERFGAVVIDGAGRVADLAGLAQRRADAAGGAAGEPAGRGVFAGVHLADAALLERLPAEGASCVVRQGYVPAMADGEDLRGVLHVGAWNDLGTVERYLDTHVALFADGYPGGAAGVLLWGDAPPPGALPAFAIDAAGREHGDRAAVSIHADARLEPPLALGAGAQLQRGAAVGPFAFVDRDAVVEADAALSRAVVWPTAAVPAGAVVRDAVVLRHRGKMRIVQAEPDEN